MGRLPVDEDMNEQNTVPVADIRDVLEAFLDDLKRLGRSKATIEAYGKDVRSLARFLESHGHSLDVGSLEPEIIEQWDADSAARLKPSSRNRKMSAVAAFLDFARKRRLIREDPMDVVERAREVQEEAPCPTRDEVERIIAAEEDMDWRLVFFFLAETGLRRAEVTALTVKDLDLDKAKVTVRHGKGGKRRMVPILSADLLDQLREYVADRTPEQHLFHSTRGGKLRGQALWERLRRAIKRAGLQDKGFSTHSLRHYFLTRKLEEGHSIHLVQRWAGHSDPSMILRVYAHVQEQAQNAEVAARSADRRPPGPQTTLPAQQAQSAALTTSPLGGPPVIHVNVDGRMVALPVLGTILVVPGGFVPAGGAFTETLQTDDMTVDTSDS